MLTFGTVGRAKETELTDVPATVSVLNVQTSVLQDLLRPPTLTGV